jgi:cytochrome c nitrite reductase small subunit
MSRLTAWASILGGLFGLTAGIGGFTFMYAEGASYLGHDSAACANCHIMSDHYDRWIKSSHRSVAECNDCHTPPGLVEKYATKAINGFNHSSAFTTGWFHEPILITARNRAIAERACRHCHEDVTQAMTGAGGPHAAGRDGISCVRCHGAVGHPDFATSAGTTGR